MAKQKHNLAKKIGGRRCFGIRVGIVDNFVLCVAPLKWALFCAFFGWK
jgi:hypothetical protein